VTPGRLAFVLLCGALLAAHPAHAAPRSARSMAVRPATPRDVARAESLATRLGSALDAGLIAPALACADSLVMLRESRHVPTLAVAAFADSLAMRFFGVGTPDAWAAAEQLFMRSLALKEQALGPADLEIALTLGALATLSDYQGHWDQAVVRAERALAIRRAQVGPGDPLVASSMRQLGMLEFSLGQYAQADSLIAGSLAIYQALPGDWCEQIADALNNLGEIRRVEDDYAGAEQNFRRGIALACGRLAQDAPLRAALINNLAGLYRDLARYADAEPLLEESLRLSEKSSYAGAEGLATAHLNLAEIYRLQGRNDEAAPLYAKALAMARPALGDDNPDLTPFVNQAGVSFEELGRYAEAEPLFREALAKAQRALGPDHPLVAQSLNDLGRLLERMGAYAAAESSDRRARDIRIARLGERHPEVATSRVQLARCLSLASGRGDEPALRELEPAIAVLDSTRAQPEARLDAYALRSAIRQRAGRSDTAIADLTVALGALDSLRAQRGGGDATRAAFIARHLDLYHRMMVLRLAAGDEDGALEAHERSRARVMRDQLALAGVDLRAGLSPSERAPLEHEEALARAAVAHATRAIDTERMRADLTEVARLEHVAALEAARDSAAWRLERTTEAIKDRSPLWRIVLTTNGRPATRTAIQSSLARDEVLLEYHVGEEGSWVFAIEPGRRRVQAEALTVDADAARELNIPPGPLGAGALERAISGDSTRAGIADLLSGARTAGAVAEIDDATTPGTLERRLHALWRTLVPVVLRARVQRSVSAIVVPDGALHLVPFDALVIAPRGAGHATRYWLDQGPAVRYAASATSLLGFAARDAARPHPAVSALSVSDPAFGPGTDRTWPPLAGTRSETDAIRAGFAPRPVHVLSGAEATEPAVRAALPGHSIVHLATHGFVTERRNNVLAGLVLAPSPAGGDDAGSDGLLQLFEIYVLPLDCDLAILSACETARGTRVAGEGVFALSRGFHAAGAARVIASLWPVNDASTAALMGAMFSDGALTSSGRPATDWTRVLRDAKRVVRAHAETAAPFFWAPFVLSGLR